MIDHVVFDVEIQVNPEELPNRWADKHLMKVGMAALWEFRTDRMRVYGPEDVQALQARLLKADRVSGFNQRDFDCPVVWGIPDGQTSPELQAVQAKCDDVLQRIWRALGCREKGWKLEQIAPATLNVQKVGNGADAPGLFQSGQWGKLCNYVCDDVAIERDLAVFVERHGFVIGEAGRPLRLPPWEKLCP